MENTDTKNLVKTLPNVCEDSWSSKNLNKSYTKVPDKTQEFFDIESLIESLEYEPYKKYLSVVKGFNRLFEIMIKGYCSNCPDGSAGCCVDDYHKWNFPKDLIELQQIEAIKNGWEKHGEYNKCKYHNDSGCKLDLLKPPFCVAFICPDLQEVLINTYGPSENLDEFFNCLGNITYMLFDGFESRLDNLERALEYGNKIIECSE